MTTATETPHARDGAIGAATLLLALVLAAALSQPQLAAVWRTGAFFDSDDAMRAVELRDFLAGQGWFDVTAHRLDPPHGAPMHWSRLVDLALAALQVPLSHVLAPQQAERAMRLLFPFTLLATLLGLSGWIGGLLAGPRARLLAIWLVVLSGPMFAQFAPGRIDHHAPQIVILLAAFGFLLKGLDPARAPFLALVATLMALSMAISLENLPFFAPMAGAVLWLYIAQGAAARARLLWFAAGALFAFPLFFAATVAPGTYAQPACDAFSAPWLGAVLAAALALAALALAAPNLDRRARALATAGVATASLAVFVALAPKCLRGPFADLDPLVARLWLAHVREVMSLRELVAQGPGEAIALAAPAALGLVAALGRLRATEGRQRLEWALTSVTIALGLCASALHIRVFSSVTPLAMVALAGGVAALVARFDPAPMLRNMLAGVLVFCLSPVGFALAFVDAGAPAPRTEAACLTPQALAPLAALPAGRVISPFNMGAHVLAQTPHAAFAAPYHRNNHGNRLAAEVFLATPEKAEALTRAAGATLIVWCKAAQTPSPLVVAAPHGLAAMLARGEAPAWLERRASPDAPLLVFAPRSME